MFDALAFVGNAAMVLAASAVVGAIGGTCVGAHYGHPVLGCVVGMISLPVGVAAAYVSIESVRQAAHDRRMKDLEREFTGDEF